jgi:hypothetical protein
MPRRGRFRTVKCQELIPMLLNELQRQQQELTELPELRRQLEQQRRELAELRALISQGRMAEAVMESPTTASKP